MTLIALIGGVAIILPESFLNRWIKPLVAFAAGSLKGGAFLHMLPHAMQASQNKPEVLVWIIVGFASFFALDQILEWHHCHKGPSQHIRPLGPLLLIADATHNFLGGLAIGAIFVVDIKAGIAAWIAAALHEIPQEIGDFGAIYHSGYSRSKTLLLNFISALTFPIGTVIAWYLGTAVDISFLIALGCGNFIYIASADLIPEVKRAEKLTSTLERFGFFLLGVFLLYLAQ